MFVVIFYIAIKTFGQQNAQDCDYKYFLCFVFNCIIVKDLENLLRKKQPDDLED